MTKYGLLMGDTHCGHLVGLTPPDWQVRYSPESTTKRRKWSYICRALWGAFDEILHELPKLDFVVANGDLIDGKGQKSGGTELITSDMQEQCDIAINIFNHVKKFCKKNAHFVGTYGCLTPGHRILTADLRWVNVETLKKGDKLLAFSEDRDVDTKRRYYCESTVIDNRTIKKPVYAIHLSDGTVLKASVDHKFVIKHRKGLRWVSVQELIDKIKFCKIHNQKCVMEMNRYFNTWETDKSYESGYIAGVFDGEGSFSMSKKPHRTKKNEYTCRINATQNENELFYTTIEYLNKLNVKICVTNPKLARGNNTRDMIIMGGLSKILEFLGRFRPPRLLSKLQIDKLGSLKRYNRKKTYIEHIEYLGRRNVCALGTTSKTYISEGFLSHNTDYHSSTQGDEWENVIAHQCFDKIGSHEWINVNGCVLDIRHKEGSSSVPYSRHTSPAKSGIWNILWSARGEQPKSDLIVRSHVHYYSYAETTEYASLTLPALQGMGSKYGAKQCVGTVDWGVVLIEIDDKGEFILHPKIRRIEEQKTKAVVI